MIPKIIRRRLRFDSGDDAAAYYQAAEAAVHSTKEGLSMRRILLAALLSLAGLASAPAEQQQPNAGVTEQTKARPEVITALRERFPAVQGDKGQRTRQRGGFLHRTLAYGL